ncbi:MAG: DUF6873 family GME fold protein [Bacteroidota bacterium]
MWILINKQAPEPAKNTLRSYGQLIEFETHGITYIGIRGHVDVFCAQLPDGSLVVAPNTPDDYLKHFLMNKIPIVLGKKKVLYYYPRTVHYNAVITPTYLIHNTKHTDKVLSELCSGLIPVHVEQGYTACNLIALPGNIFITGDKGINESLQNAGLDVRLVDDRDVLLKRYKHGFWGGAVGLYQQNLFICGSLAHHASGEQIKQIAYEANVEIVELFDGQIEDIGGIRFVENTI